MWKNINFSFNFIPKLSHKISGYYQEVDLDTTRARKYIIGMYGRMYYFLSFLYGQKTFDELEDLL